MNPSRPAGSAPPPDPAGPERPVDPERQRLREAKEAGVPWFHWGPYLSERQWGNPREDYSADGQAWTYFPHDHARSRVYRWAEDGLLGISDDRGLLCFALALWNGADPILKERAFGLGGPEGNHGEDVKEAYYYLDNTPTHSYQRALYKYPRRAFPYEDLVDENRRRDRTQPEYELLDTGIFAEDRYFDVTVEYAKAAPDDLVIRISATNRGPDPAPLHLLPTLWFRNTWAWELEGSRPTLRGVAALPGEESGDAAVRRVEADQADLGRYYLACRGAPELLFTENETNAKRLWGAPNRAPRVKDGFHDAIVHGARDAVNPAPVGTKVAAHYTLSIAPGATESVWLRLGSSRIDRPFADAEQILADRRADADAFYAGLNGARLDEDTRSIQRQAFAGLLWSKQFYNYDVGRWLAGDPGEPTPPTGRRHGRNSRWPHFDASDVLIMPDAWEFAWMASWDLAFHCVALSLIDPETAKQQILTVLQDTYQHPNGQVPAYEWNFSDVNPPVQAWAAWEIYRNDKRLTGAGDRVFLEEVFGKLLLNWTWWVNREDPEGRNLFQGGFLGLDNIGVFDRSAPLPGGEELEQADGTAWMGSYCAAMLAIAIELAREDRAHESIAAQFFEHFLDIAGALENLGDAGISLWDKDDQFFYDVLYIPNSAPIPLRLRTLVGLLPLLAVEIIDPDVRQALPEFARRTDAFLREHPDLAKLIARWHDPAVGDHRLLALVDADRLRAMLRRMLDPEEFLSDHGIRSLSRIYGDRPYTFTVNGQDWTIPYEPGTSTTYLYGGNSNWRGPIWFPTSYLIIHALHKLHRYHGDDFRVECPTGSGQLRSLSEVADELSRRLIGIFRRGPDGRRPVFGDYTTLQTDPHWRDYIWFHEYFHGETGAGQGASHQTGWTALVAALIEETRE